MGMSEPDSERRETEQGLSRSTQAWPKSPEKSPGSLGDTQPFRPAKQYRPLTSEPPIEESPLQETAPYKAIRPANVSHKSGSLTLILGLIALLLLIAAVVAFFLIKGAGGAGGKLPAERALPPNTLAYLSVSPVPTESQRTAFDTIFKTFEAQPGFADAAGVWVQRLLGLLGGTVPSTDVATLDMLAGYLGGDVTIAVLTPSQGDIAALKASGDGSIGPLAAFDVAGRNLVALVDLDFASATNPQGLIAGLRAAKDNLDKAKLVETYNGSDIREYTAGSLHVYFSLLGGTSTAAVGISTAPVKTLIDSLRQNQSLQEADVFKYLSGKVPADRVASLYLNLSEASDLLAQLRSQSTNAPRIEGALLMTFSGQNEGLLISAALQADIPPDAGAFSCLICAYLGGLQIDTSSKPDAALLNDLPVDTFAFVAGSGLGAAGRTLLDAAEKAEDESAKKAAADWQQEVKNATGLDLRQEILPWLSGDFTFSLAGSDPAANTGLPLVGQLRLAPAERPQAASAIERGMRTALGSGMQTFSVADGTFYGGLNLGRGLLLGVSKDRAILILDRDLGAARAWADNLSSTLGKGFGARAEWKAAAPHLPDESNVIAYSDAVFLRGILERDIDNPQAPQVKAAYEREIAPFLRSVKYAAAGVVIEPTGEGVPAKEVGKRGLITIFLGLGK